jgi:DNA-binding XRE family transcriptional regulator
VATAPVIRLRDALAPRPARELIELAERTGVRVTAVRRAAKGRSVSVDEFLAIAAATAIDPMTGEPRLAHAVGSFHVNQFGCAVRMVRYQRDETQRQFAKAMHISASTLCRIERGDEVLIESIVKVCRFIGRHPHDFTAQNVSRETPAETTRHETQREFAP